MLYCGSWVGWWLLFQHSVGLFKREPARAEEELRAASAVSAPFALLDPRHILSRYQLASFLVLDRQPAEAEKIFAAMAPLYDGVSKPSLPDEANFMYAYGSLYVSRYEPAKAAPLLQRSLKVLEADNKVQSALGGDVLNVLGKVNRDQGLTEEAKRYFVRAIDVRSKLYGPASEPACTSLYDFAFNDYVRGDFAAAANTLQHALTLEEKLGPDYQFYALNGLAAAALAEGHTEDARKYLSASMKMENRLSSGRPRSVSYTVGRLGYIFQQQKKFDEADRFYKAAIALNELAGQVDAPEFVEAERNYLSMLTMQGRTAEAVELQKEMKETAEAVREHGRRT